MPNETPTLTWYQRSLINWKTTSAGILAIVGAVTHLVFAIKGGNCGESEILGVATAILGGAGLLFARDSNVSSEASGATK